MECPTCNGTMQEGFIFYPNAFGVPWLPAQASTPRFYSEEIIHKKGGIMIAPHYLGPHPRKIKTWICIKCKKAVVDFNEV